jgi:uncharacterized protein (TIGR03437 family)
MRRIVMPVKGRLPILLGVPVWLALTESLIAAPAISPGGVVNAASYTPGPFAPGDILAIFGTGLGPTALTQLQLTDNGQSVSTVLAGTRVLFDGMPAPLLYTSAAQVAVVVPYSVSGHARTQVQVEYLGQLSYAVTVPVAESDPAIFTADASGKGTAAALNEDLTVHRPMNPANKGAMITVYATGAGLMNPPSADGQVEGSNLAHTVLPVSVTVDGIEAKVVYAGSAPSLVSGVLQVNVEVPVSLIDYGPKSIRLKVGNRTSPDGVTITVARIRAVPAQSLLKIPVPANDVAYDPIAVMLYAAIASAAPKNPNTIAMIDPFTGQLLGSIPVGVDPTMLALSDDGHFLWMSADADQGHGAIERVDFYTEAVDLKIPLASAFADQNLPAGTYLNAGFLAAIPGRPHSVAAVAAVSSGDSPQLPVAFFDDGTRRPHLGPVPDSLSVAFDQDEHTAWTASKRITVDDQGAADTLDFYDIWNDAGAAYFPQTHVVIANHGRVFGSDGWIFRMDPMGLEGRVFATLDEGDYNLSYGYTYRSRTNTLLFAETNSDNTLSVVSFDAEKYVPSSQMVIPLDLTGPFSQIYGSRLVDCGPIGFAIGGASRLGPAFNPGPIFVVPDKLLTPYPSVPLPRAQPDNGGVRQFQLAVNSVVYDSKHEKFYVATPSAAGSAGNSIVALDPVSGTFSSPVLVGSEPDLPTLSSSGDDLYVMLQGAKKIGKFSLPTLSLEYDFPALETNGAFIAKGAWSWVKEMQALPGQPDSLVVAHADLFNLIPYDLGIAIYDHGTQRPDSASGNTIQVSTTGDILWSYDNQGGNQFSKWGIGPDGLTWIASGTVGCYGCSGTSIRCQSNVCFTGSGTILDPTSLTIAGTLSSSQPLDNQSWVAPDLAHDRVYFADGQLVMAFQFSSRTQIGSYFIPQGATDINSFFLWRDNLVVGRSSELDIVPVSVLKP